MNEKWMNPTACEGVPIRGDMAPDRVAQLMCSACHKIESHKTDFCPNCGAKMGGTDG